MGLSSAGSLPILVALDGSRSHVAREFFEAKHGATEEGQSFVEQQLQQHTIFYGIVDGLHRLLALQRLSNEQPEWAGWRLYNV